ncbi:SDR family oxidoreductase [Microbulbifer sp. 2205BS26-8]|uniref:SDR family oxidoreductase n=1 Tax=Microbulbifer sp. 2205BS26-8 TaxID=3064386 RepID=UPI00273D1636|nr:SDR family oxidoreductase [Microbulbifer sp. 2205BS26-8]MDP5208559.1 SDR family oxidoreductase [Microbulbifer sp. 2205BS26-8]
MNKPPVSSFRTSDQCFAAESLAQIGRGYVVPDRVALITGCSSGIGRELALALHRRGTIVIATARRPESLQELADMGIATEALNVNSQADINRVVYALKTAYGRLDILINNAGYGQMGPLLELDTRSLENQFRTNVFAPLALARACVPLMRTGRGGIVCNIGSVSGVLATPFSGAYCASKAALHSLTDVLRLELKPFGIHVMTVQPGAIVSEFGRHAEVSLRGLLLPDSLYKREEEVVRARAQESQKNATLASALARRLVRELLRKRPRTLVRIGNRSSLLPWMARWLPRSLRDRILLRRFRLHRLSHRA